MAIYKIIKENCYSLTSQKFLKNKFTRVAGELFSRYKEAESIIIPQNLAFSTFTQLGTTFPVLMGPQLVFVPGTGWMNVFLLAYYTISYSVIRINDIQSQSPLPQDIGDFIMQIAMTTSNATLGTITRNVQWSNSLPSFSLTTASNYERDNMGRATGTITRKTPFLFDLELRVITRINYREETNIPGVGTNRTITATSPLSYNLTINIVKQEKTPFQIGSQDTRREFPIQGNELLDSLALFKNADNTETALVTRLAGIILSNYENGKQFIYFSYPLHSLKAIIGTAETNNINIGMYITVYDDFNNPIYTYKGTELPKIFEIVDCTFQNEEWNIIAKEIAR